MKKQPDFKKKAEEEIKLKIYSWKKFEAKKKDC
jgi:hypothetical protein